jgi:formylglycine-generating enzyme required for sulfatase activity
MAGNVWEWCWDWEGSDYYSTSKGTTDPRGPVSGTYRVDRGGGWNNEGGAVYARCADRNGSMPHFRYDNHGFRPARGILLDAVAATNSAPDAIPARSANPNTMVQIPGGSFTMGRTSGDTDPDAPPITVTVSPFYIQQTETTKAQWDEVRTWAVGEGYTDLASGGGKAPNHPVHSVNWWDVVKWCNARSEKEGMTPVYTASGVVIRTGTAEPTANWSANGYRLPTEAEWEKAARGGGSGKRFPWGTDTISHAQANFRNYGGEAYVIGATGNHPSYPAGGEPYTSPVESLAANGHGLFGMAGNVSEWCWDWRGPSYYTTSNGTTDPRGPASGLARVNRGGSWNYSAIYARSAARNALWLGGSLNYVGFRIARSSVP